MSFRSLYVIITLVVVCSLLTAALIYWGPGDEQGPHAAGLLQRLPVAPVCCIVLAVGVILLGWCWLSLARVITSIARLVADDTMFNACARKTTALSAMLKADELQRAIADGFHELTTRIGR